MGRQGGALRYHAKRDDQLDNLNQDHKYDQAWDNDQGHDSQDLLLLCQDARHAMSSRAVLKPASFSWTAQVATVTYTQVKVAIKRALALVK